MFNKTWFPLTGLAQHEWCEHPNIRKRHIRVLDEETMIFITWSNTTVFCPWLSPDSTVISITFGRVSLFNDSKWWEWTRLITILAIRRAPSDHRKLMMFVRGCVGLQMETHHDNKCFSRPVFLWAMSMSSSQCSDILKLSAISDPHSPEVPWCDGLSSRAICMHLRSRDSLVYCYMAMEHPHVQ